VKAEPRRTPPLARDRATWLALKVPQRRQVILQALLSGESQSSLALRFGASLSNISLRAREAYRGSPFEKTHPTAKKRASA
jgi:DNA-binding NarL/FixJ family response regulator